MQNQKVFDSIDKQIKLQPNLQPQEFEEMQYKQTNLRQKNKDQPWILYPDDKLKKVWEVVVGVLVIYTATFMPYILAFVNDQSWDQIQHVVDFFFVIDIIINFNSAYFDEHNVLITKRSKILKNYLTGWFFIDFISVFPFQRLQDLNTKQKDQNIIKFARITKMFQLQRLFKLTRLIRLFKIVNVFQEIGIYLQNNLGISQSLERLFASSIVLILFCHIYSCFWYIIQKIIEADKVWYKVHEIEENQTNFSVYISCYYFILQTFVTTGYGDLSPQNTEEYIVIIILMILGCFVYSFIIGNLIDLLQTYNNRLKEKQNKVNIIENMQVQYNIPKNKVLIAKYHIKNSQDLSYGPDQLIESLNHQEKMELIYRIQKQKLEGIHYFANKSKEFICLTSYDAVEIRLKKQETFYFQNDKAQELYFLKEGQIGYCISNTNDMLFLKIEKGEIFGDLEYFYYSEKRRYKAVATQNCILYSINKSKFTDVLTESFQREYNQLQIQSYLKKKQIKLIWQKAFDYKFYEKSQNQNVDIEVQYTLFRQIEDDLFQQYQKTIQKFDDCKLNDQSIDLQLYFDNKYEHQNISNLESQEKQQDYYIKKINQINTQIEVYQQQSDQQTEQIVALKEQIKQIEILFNSIYKECIQQKFGINNLNLDTSQFGKTYENILKILSKEQIMIKGKYDRISLKNKISQSQKKKSTKSGNYIDISIVNPSKNMISRLQMAMKQIQSMSHVKGILQKNKQMFNNLSVRYQRRHSISTHNNVHKNHGNHQFYKAISKIQENIQKPANQKLDQTMKTIYLDEFSNPIKNSSSSSSSSSDKSSNDIFKGRKTDKSKGSQTIELGRVLRKKTTLTFGYEEQQKKLQYLIEQSKHRQQLEKEKGSEIMHSDEHDSYKEIQIQKLVSEQNNDINQDIDQSNEKADRYENSFQIMQRFKIDSSSFDQDVSRTKDMQERRNDDDLINRLYSKEKDRDNG